MVDDILETDMDEAEADAGADKAETGHETPEDGLQDGDVDEGRKTSRGFGAVFGTALFAALIGAAAGAGAAYYFHQSQMGAQALKTQAETAQITKLTKTVRADRAQIEGRISLLESQISHEQDAAHMSDETLADLTARLTNLEQSLKGGMVAPLGGMSVTLGAEPDGDVTPESMTSESMTSEDATDATDATVEGVVSKVVTNKTDKSGTKNTGVEPVSASVPAPSPTLVLLPFPKEALLRAAQENVSGGFLKRTLSKHVHIMDEDDPRTMILAIETDVAASDYAAALIKFDKLPRSVQEAGRAWQSSVKAVQ